jgi:hypothetical protein
MKCIRNKSTGKITRVLAIEALELVQAGTHEFTSKSAWKAQKAKED